METIIDIFVGIFVVIAFMGYMLLDYYRSKRDWLKLVEKEKTK